MGPGGGRVRRVGGDEKGVAVRLGARHVAGCDGGVGAGFVLDDDLLAQDGRQFGSEYPADGVGARTRGERHDQGDGFVGIVGGAGGGGRHHGRCANQRGAQQAQVSHGLSPVFVGSSAALCPLPVAAPSGGRG
ncbi:hypothetical protein G6F65_020953 [Rhizopus arrhizus]|nr:hypothetical protein G6F65_020953 [Rhizopus arrhizus]